MIKHETDITNSDIFIIGESVYSERFRLFLQEPGQLGNRKQLAFRLMPGTTL